VPGVYIAYPFCAQKCTYCNFASGVFPRELEARYVAALRAEIGGHRWEWTPETVYLGGGTPSLMEALPLDLTPGRPWAEATLEAAPGSITAERAHACVAAGINRVSLGVQSFVRGEIARTGRRHTAEIVQADVALLREHGIAAINIDLIAGLAGQTRESWRESLDWTERLAPEHVSVYMLEVDEDSRLGLEILNGGSRYGASGVPPEELTAELYETAAERLARLGIFRYEISNFARPGFESRHNLKYWKREPYVGFGADAHSFDGRRRWQSPESAREYVETPRREFTESRAEEERMFLGLRLSEGVRAEPADWERFGVAIGRFAEAGLMETSGGRLRLTPRGILLSNEIFQEFITA
jgi:oxygen-independent coproporphyrinogen-3 oxidase